MEVVARQEFPTSGSLGTDDFQKKIDCVRLEKQQIRLAGNSNLESGKYANVGVSTTATPLNGSPDTDGSRKNFELEYHYKM